MKKCFVKTSWGGLIALSWTFLFFVGAAPFATAAQPQQARVSQVIQDVRLLEAHTAPRPAVVNDKLILGTAVRTGVESRVELTFTDFTITRLGANTIFSFSRGARELELTSGAVLLEVPPNKAPVRVNTSAVTVAITGGTALFATGPPTKFMVLEGIGTFYPAGHPEKAVTVHGGEMVMMTADGHITKPEKFDVKLVIETSRLILDFPPLTNLPLILALVNQQIAEQQVAGTTSQTLAKNLVDLIDVTDQNANANPVVLASTSTQSPPPPPPPPPPPSPTPTKFGTPTVITSPVPYVITSGTTITTDPSITTDGVTDYGKIYRGPAIDGAFSLWAFGSTSAVDTALDFDTHFNNAGHFPAAAFKFASLVFAGNPTIDLSNGGVTNLALISVGDITSGLPGGALTLTGLDALLLASQGGSINLGSDITFQDIPTLFFYARGTNGDLTLASPIVGTTDLFLYAGRNIAFNAGTDLILGGQFSARSVGGNISVSESGNINVGGSLSVTTDVSADAANGGNITFATGGFLSASNFDAETTIEPGVTLNNGANITVNIGRDLTINSGDSLLTVGDSNGAHIGTGGNIAVSVGGDLTTSGLSGGAGDFALVVQNTNGLIDNGGNITLAVGGSVSTQGQLNLLVENYNETANPAGHIGTGGNISLMTGGNLTADSMSVAINNRAGGVIDSGVNLVLNIGGALTTLHDGVDFLGNTASLSLAISNRYDNNTAGSSIDGDATLLFHSDSASIGGLLAVAISDRGGTIDGNAVLNFSVTHNITVQGTDNTNFQGESAATWQILNDSGPSSGAASPFGGTIHGNATLLLSATNLTVPAGSLDVEILNQNSGVSGPGGTIDSSANITFNLSGNLTTQTDASFAIRNNHTASGPGGIDGIGGTIGQDAVLSINANSLAISGRLDTSIHNGRNAGDNGGTIGGNATINLVVVGGITALDDSQFIGNGGGTIGSNAAIIVTAASLAATDTAPGALSASINNNSGGNVGGSASINLDLSGNLTSASDANFLIDNSNGGTIASDATVSVSAGNITANSLLAQIDNSNRGMIGGAANVAINVGNDVTALNGINVLILNGNSGHIVTGANVLYSVGGTTSTTNLDESIDNSNGGTIYNGGNVTLHTVGPVMLDGAFSLETDNFNGGTITNGGNVMAHFVGDVTATLGDFHSFNFFVVNGGNDFVGDLGGGTIGTGGNIDATFHGNAATTPIATSGSFAAEIANDHGNIGTGGNISVTIGGNLTCGPLFVYTSNRYGGQIGTGGNVTLDVVGNVSSADQAFLEVVNNGGSIGSGTNVTLNVGGDLSTQAGAFFQILNNDDGNGSGPGTIGGDATISVTATNISTGGAFDAEIDNFNGGMIGGNATINVDAANITANSLFARIDNSNGGTINNGAALSMSIGGNVTSGPFTADIINDFGHIGTSATVDFHAVGSVNVTGAAFLDIYSPNGTIGSDAIVDVVASDVSTSGDLVFGITNDAGSIGGNAAAALNATGNVESSSGNFFLNILNNGGTIGKDATIGLATAALSAGLLETVISNNAGIINGVAAVTDQISGNIVARGDAFFQILNNDAGAGGGTIGGDATINVSANNISTGGALAVTIDNTGGSIGANSEGGAMINMNVSNSATVTNDATVAIYGSDGAVGGAGININGGNYNVGGTFLSYIDGDGTITFNNASAHADVLKAGVFGANGALNIGGGTLSADSTLKLYAPGSNGQLNFMSNVTLGGNSIKILAANSVTIFNNVVVTIGGPNPADVYTGFTGEIPKANYTGFGGNGTTTGTFAGAGANRPRPLSDAPPFGAPSPGNPTNGKRSKTVINIPNSGQLLSLLDGAVPAPDGRLRLPRDKQRHAANADRLNVNRMIKADRDMADVRRMRDRGVINNRLGGGTRAF